MDLSDKCASRKELKDCTFYLNFLLFLTIKVWFLILTPNGFAYYDRSNKDDAEISVLIGKPTYIRFIHFGTNQCKGLKLDGDENTEAYLHLFQLTCKLTPQISNIYLHSPAQHLQGRYTIR